MTVTVTIISAFIYPLLDTLTSFGLQDTYLPDFAKPPLLSHLPLLAFSPLPHILTLHLLFVCLLLSPLFLSELIHPYSDDPHINIQPRAGGSKPIGQTQLRTGFFNV
jgi:hypothetical protein